MLLFLLRLSRDFVIRQTAGRLKITFVCLRLFCSLEHLFLVHYTVFKEHPVPELPSSHRAAFPSTRSRCSLPFAPLGSHLGFARLSLSSDSFAIIPPPQAFVNTFFRFSFRKVRLNRQPILEKASASQSKRLFYYVVLVRNANVAVRGYRFLRNSIRN